MMNRLMKSELLVLFVIQMKSDAVKFVKSSIKRNALIFLQPTFPFIQIKTKACIPGISLSAASKIGSW